ncbi:ribokinase [Jannaschia ovalis]|uniref:Ribokinase n=1 Tax=Jannaschia ovalis TaxID=3038773 RepID=A0ABY8LE53_9RHOB|nr:ribokinase [Jannaschia sp. GRR-S6-38]WGH79600.1 ribokinase [Jannaschia sp. GRR-S6-38]
MTETPQTDARPRRALVFGNAAIDEVFQVRDLPAAGESVLGRAGHTGLGGKGTNQAIALARTGVPTRLVAAVGTDWHGRAIRDALGHEPVEPALVDRPDIPSDRSIIFAQEDGDNVIVTTNACARSLTFADCRAELAGARPGDAMLLQGNLDRDVTAALCRAGRDRGLFTVLNPSPFDAGLRDLLPLTDALFVNANEARALTGCAGRDAVAALRRAGVAQVVLTLGAEGALLGSGADILHVPARPAEVVDVTGAGDCFEGVAIGSALRRRTRLDEIAIRHAGRAAAHTIGSLGTARAFPSPRRMSEILDDLLDR